MKSPQHYTKQFRIDKAVTPWSELTRKQRDEIRACEDWHQRDVTGDECHNLTDAMSVVDAFIEEMLHDNK